MKSVRGTPQFDWLRRRRECPHPPSNPPLAPASPRFVTRRFARPVSRAILLAVRRPSSSFFITSGASARLAPVSPSPRASYAMAKTMSFNRLPHSERPRQLPLVWSHSSLFYTRSTPLMNCAIPSPVIVFYSLLTSVVTSRRESGCLKLALFRILGFQHSAASVWARNAKPALVGFRCVVRRALDRDLYPCTIYL